MQKESVILVDAGNDCYVAGIFTMNSGSIKNNTVTSGTTQTGITMGGLGKGVYVKNGATFTLGSANGIASDQIVYLQNTNTEDCRISLSVGLTSDLSVQCASDTVGTQVAIGSSSVITNTTRDHFKYSGHTFERTGGSGERNIYIAS